MVIKISTIKHIRVYMRETEKGEKGKEGREGREKEQ